MKNIPLGILLGSMCMFAGPQGISGPQVQSALGQLQSSEWSQRSAGFYAIVRAGLRRDAGSDFPVADGVLAIARADAVSRAGLVEALTALLDLETTFVSSGQVPASEEYSTYYGDVIQALTTLRDASSTHVLLRCLNTGKMAITALAGSGDEALSEALNLLPTADDQTRHSLFRLFAEMAEPRNMNNLARLDSRSHLLNALLAGANDNNPFSRLAVAQGLARFASPNAAKALSRLAASDPFSVTVGNAVHYPVRDAETRALQTITAPQE